MDLKYDRYILIVGLCCKARILESYHKKRKMPKQLRHRPYNNTVPFGRLRNPFKAFRNIRAISTTGVDTSPSDDEHEDEDPTGELNDKDSPAESFEVTLDNVHDALVTHLQTRFGGEKPFKEAKQFGRCFKNLVTYYFSNAQRCESGSSLEMGVRNIIHSHYAVIGEYLESFANVLKANSILNYWNFILTSLRWFHYDCEYNNERCKGTIDGFEHYMKRLRKAYKRSVNRENLSRTYEKLVEEGRMPAGGLRELCGYVKSQLAWALSLKEEDFKSKKVYNNFTDWLYCNFWVTMVQGRTGGFEDMTYGQRHGLLDPDGHETSTHFKTALYHNMQAVSSSELASIGMKIYLELARPAVATTIMYSDSAPLFLTATGIKEYRVGAKVTDFFHRHGNLHITTTAIRGMYETEADDLCSRNIISPKEKDAVTWLNGHSGKTVRQYYIKKRVQSSVADARKVMSIIQNNNVSEISVVDSERPVEMEDTYDGMALCRTGDCATADWDSSCDQKSDMNDHASSVWGHEQWRDDRRDILGAAASVVDDNEGWCQMREHNTRARSSCSSATTPVMSHLGRSLSPANRGTSSTSPVRCLSNDWHGGSPNNNVLGYERDARQQIPLRVHRNTKEAYVPWSVEEIEYAQKAYDIIYAQLHPEQKRFIVKHILKHIRNDPKAKAIFHPSHLESTGKFRHVIRVHVMKEDSTEYDI